MKKILLIFMLFVSSVAIAQKERYSTSARADVLDYPLTVRVTRSEVVTVPSAAGPVTMLHVNVLIEGRKFGLETSAGALLHPGDYSARVVKNDEKKSGWYSRSYELLFSDRTHVIFNVVSEGE